MVELDVKIGAKELYDYMLMHTYNSPSGILGSGFGGVLVVAGALRGQWIFVIAGIFLLLYLPWTLFIKSRQQAANNPAFQESLHYVLDESGLTISQGEATATQAWEDMVKAVSTNKSIIIYTSNVNATIIPKDQMGDLYMSVLEIISTHMPPKKVKIKA